MNPPAAKDSRKRLGTDDDEEEDDDPLEKLNTAKVPMTEATARSAERKLKPSASASVNPANRRTP